MDDFYMERELESAGIDAFEFSLMDEDERRETLGDAGLDPDFYQDADLDSGFDAWERLRSAGLSLGELDLMDEDERREALEDAGLDPADYGVFSDPVPYAPARSEPPRPPAVPKQPASAGDRQTHGRETVCRYLQVRLSPGSRLSSYRTEDRTIRAGDLVVVPTGGPNEVKCVRVVSAGDYTRSTAPCLPESARFIIRKAADSAPAPEPAAPKADEAPEPDAEDEGIKREKRKRKILLAVIAGLSLVIIVLLARLIGSVTELG